MACISHNVILVDIMSTKSSIRKARVMVGGGGPNDHGMRRQGWFGTDRNWMRMNVLSLHIQISRTVTGSLPHQFRWHHLVGRPRGHVPRETPTHAILVFAIGQAMQAISKIVFPLVAEVIVP